MRVCVIFAISLGALPTIALSNDCIGVIQAAKVISQRVAGQDLLDQHASNFCNEYSKSRSKQNSSKAKASYKFLSASGGTANNSEEKIASRYCSAEDSSIASANAYEEYVESISPRAYSAYEACLELAKKDIHLNLNPSSMLPLQFSVALSYDSGVRDDLEADLEFSPSNEVSCSWGGGDSGTKITISNGTTINLECSRNSNSERSYVRVTRTDGTKTSMTIPWSAYSDNGIPVDFLKQTQEKYTALLEAHSTLMSSLTGAVMAFNSKSCPEGWVEFKEAYGRFIRGIDKSGRIDPDGHRKPGDRQSDGIASHSHEVKSTKVHKRSGRSTIDTIGVDLDVHEKSKTTGGAETRPKNVALLYCQFTPKQ